MVSPTPSPDLRIQVEDYVREVYERMTPFIRATFHILNRHGGMTDDRALAIRHRGVEAK